MYAEKYTVSEAATNLGITEEQVWAEFEEGRMAAVALAESVDPEGKERFSWWSLPREAILRMRAGTHNEISWESYGFKFVAKSNPDMIRALTKDCNATNFADAIFWKMPINEDTVQSAPAAKAEAVTVTPLAPAALPDEIDHDEKLAALFDPVPVESLAKTFPTNTVDFESVAQWKKWTEAASRNGLNGARSGRAKFNPYKAGLWFVGKGVTGWDKARLHRVLASKGNLPERSINNKSLLTGE